MKITLLLFALTSLFLVADTPLGVNPDYIFTAVKRNGENVSAVLLNVRTVYLGTMDEWLELYLPDSVKIEASTEYLFTLHHDKNTNIIEVMSVLPVTEATPEIQKLFFAIHCVDDNKKSTRPCQRDLQSVCGCDGKTYGNICELRKAGVNIYTFGRCK